MKRVREIYFAYSVVVIVLILLVLFVVNSDNEIIGRTISGYDYNEFAGSCQGLCEEGFPDGCYIYTDCDCYCDSLCEGFGDCCFDYIIECTNTFPDPEPFCPGQIFCPDIDPATPVCVDYLFECPCNIGVRCLDGTCRENINACNCESDVHCNTGEDPGFPETCLNSCVNNKCEPTGNLVCSFDNSCVSDLSECGCSSSSDCPDDGTNTCAIDCVNNQCVKNYANCVIEEPIPIDDLPIELSCVNSCGGFSGQCWCDDLCTGFGDCCDDYLSVC